MAIFTVNTDDITKRCLKISILKVLFKFHRGQSVNWFTFGRLEWNFREVIVKPILSDRCQGCLLWNCFQMNGTQDLNSSPPEQNGCHFAGNIFKYIFVNEKFCILINISLKFVPKGQVNNIPPLVQIMAWHRIGDKPLSEPMLTQFTDAYMRH